MGKFLIVKNFSNLVVVDLLVDLLVVVVEVEESDHPIKPERNLLLLIIIAATIARLQLLLHHSKGSSPHNQ